MFKLDNIEPVWNSNVVSFNGKEFLESVTVKNKITNETKDLKISGAFIAVGMTPNVDYLGNAVEQIPGGWIKTDSSLETSVKGVYATGDVRDTPLRQVVTSVSDGALAVYALQKYL